MNYRIFTGTYIGIRPMHFIDCDISYGGYRIEEKLLIRVLLSFDKNLFFTARVSESLAGM